MKKGNYINKDSEKQKENKYWITCTKLHIQIHSKRFLWCTSHSFLMIKCLSLFFFDKQN